MNTKSMIIFTLVPLAPIILLKLFFYLHQKLRKKKMTVIESQRSLIREKVPYINYEKIANKKSAGNGTKRTQGDFLDYLLSNQNQNINYNSNHIENHILELYGEDFNE